MLVRVGFAMYFRDAIDAEGLQVMETALVSAAKDLGLADDDVNSREHLTRSILALYGAGQWDVERLKIYAVSRFKWAMGAPASSAIIPEGLVPVSAQKANR